MHSMNLKPDYGLYCKNEYGALYSGSITPFLISHITRINNNQYSVIEIMDEESEFAVSLEFDYERMRQLFAISNGSQKKKLNNIMTPLITETVSVELSHDRIYVDFKFHLGTIEERQHESYIPLIIDQFSKNDYFRNAFLSLPKEISHVIFSSNEAVAFGIEKPIGKQKPDENRVYAYVCFPAMPENCEYGSILCFDNLKQAQESFAWQFNGPFPFARPLKSIQARGYHEVSLLYTEYQKQFQEGFGKHGFNFK